MAVSSRKSRQLVPSPAQGQGTAEVGKGELSVRRERAQGLSLVVTGPGLAPTACGPQELRCACKTIHQCERILLQELPFPQQQKGGHQAAAGTERPRRGCG